MLQRIVSVASATALLVLPSVVGCASTGSEKVDQTSTRIDAFGASIERLQGHVRDVAASLEQVVANASLDPKPAYKEFSGHADDVADATSRARTNLDKAKTEGAKLFEAWTSRLDTIADEDIRKSSQERRDELQKALATVAEEAEPCLTKLEAFVATTKDLDTYLGQDLTATGIKGISGKADDLADDAKDIVSDLDDVVAAARKAAPQFATAKPPPAAK